MTDRDGSGKERFTYSDETALTLATWNQLIADLTSIQAVMEHAEEKSSSELAGTALGRHQTFPLRYYVKRI